MGAVSAGAARWVVMRTLEHADDEEVAELNAEPWMLRLLEANPDYTSWGPYEDAMAKDGDWWDSRMIFATWAEFGPWGLDELNECVNFYFSVERAAKQCEACDGEGMNPATREVSRSFYDFEHTGKRWDSKITEDEVDALIARGRLRDLTHEWVDDEWRSKGTRPTADEVNAWHGGRGRGAGLGHDGINRWILVETRAKRLGVYGHCDACVGKGHIYTEPKAHVSLTLWWLHPRKGCSRGIEIERIEEHEIPAVAKFLATAEERNRARFAGVARIIGG